MEQVPAELSVKRLAFAIVQFLAEQNSSGNLSEDAKEGLEVATQCLEKAFGLSADQESALSVSQSLLDIFHNATKNELPLKNESEVRKEPELKNHPVSETDKVEAERLKTEGNDLMKAGRFLDAINCYSMAIKLDGQNAVYYCNRAAAHSKAENHKSAVDDCKKAIDIDPKYAKAFGRMGLAYSSLKQHKESLEAYQKAVQLEPDNESYRVNVKISEDNLKQSTPEMPQGPFGNLLSGATPGGFDFGAILNNPNLVNMASEMMANPAMQSFMNNLVGGISLNPGASNEGGAGLDSLLRAGQQLAAQMQNANPDLVEQLRRQMGGEGGGNDPSGENRE